MPDIQPNLELERLRRIVKVEELKLSVRKNELRKREMEIALQTLDQTNADILKEIDRLEKENSNG